MAHSVIEFVSTDVVVGELEVVDAGAEVAGDVVAVGSFAFHWFMGATCSIDDGAWNCSW